MTIKELDTHPVANPSKFFKRKHSLEVHNFWIQERKRACPYCTEGSEPVPKAEIIGGLE